MESAKRLGNNCINERTNNKRKKLNGKCELILLVTFYFYFYRNNNRFKRVSYTRKFLKNLFLLFLVK
jgi:hypothetical protein